MVFFSKGHLDLEKIDKINFRGRRLGKQPKFEAKSGGLKTSLARTQEESGVKYSGAPNVNFRKISVQKTI